MNVELLTATDAVERLTPEWERLFLDDPDASPFVTPWWASAWMRHFGHSVEPWSIAVREQGRLVGLAPLTLQRRGGTRVLRVLGKEPADYWDVLSLPAHRSEVVAAVADQLAEHRRRWDQLVLDCVPPTSATLEQLASDPRFGARERATVPCPGIELPASFDEYLTRLPGKHRTKIRKHLRKLDEGELTCVSVSGAERIRDAMRLWQELRLRQWDERKARIDPLHRTETFRDFLTDVAVELIPRDLALLWEFRQEGEPVGIYLNFVDRRTFYYHLGGFDPRVSKLGLGTVSIALGIRESIARGRDYYDFMVGDEPYKYYFGAVDRTMRSTAIANATVRSRMLLRLSRTRDRLREARADG